MNDQPQDFEKKFLESEDKFDRIFNLTSAASKVINSDLIILKVNKALTELLGFSAEEIEGTRILDYACEEFKKHWHELQEALWSKKLPFFKLQVCLIKKDKSIAWVNITTILFNDNGTTYGFTVLDEFTWRKNFEESEKRLNMALTYSKVAVWELNLEDYSVVRSEGHDKLFGYDQQQESWTMENYFKHLLDDDLPDFKKAFTAVKNDSQIDCQIRIQTTNGVIKWLSFQGKTEADSNGKPAKIIGTVNDITKEKVADRFKDDFITIASHELKTPITGLKASLQLLNQMKDKPTEKLPVLVDQANKSMAKVTVLVDDLLNASKVNEDQLHLKKTFFNLSKMIDDSCYYIWAANVYSLLISGNQELKVYADAERIERVVVNFVNNAVKYATGSKEINIHIEQVDDMAKVSVIDKGPGIPPEKVSYLFDRYYRAENKGNQYSGLGLGLYICSEIIKKHNGKIGVDTILGQGSTFWFTLPLLQ